jgi:tetratricopeptide (TPR) repeat protein
VVEWVGVVAGAGLMSGCIKQALLNGQIEGTRRASAAVNTLHDYEVARSIGQAGLGQFEGMHRLAPGNADALFLLTRGWAAVSFAFIEDDYEQAHEQHDETMAEYHLLRTRAGFHRASYYGVLLLSQTAKGFERAKRNQETMRTWLVENFDTDQAEDLLWTGYAWIGHVSASREVPEVVGELYVGVELVRRSVELDETLAYATGHVVLGAYHARSALAELDESKRHFERAIELTGGRYLPAKLNLATRYYCAKGDRAAYERTLREILSAGDPLPAARLQNVVAKRRARRYLASSVWQEECGFALTG